MITYRQNVEKVAEQQQTKYLDLYTILPSEISMQLAEVSLALGAIEDQVPPHLLLLRIQRIPIPIFFFWIFLFKVAICQIEPLSVSRQETSRLQKKAK